MALFGYKSPGAPFQPGIDQNAMQIGPDQFAGQRPETAKPGFFGKGGMGRDLLMGGLGGILDGVAVWGGAKPGYQTAISEGRDFQRELVKAQLLQKLKGERNDDTPAMREAVAMGMPPGSPEFNDYVRRARMKPSFMMMGNPETGQQIVNPEAMGGGIPPEAIADLISDPSSAAEFDAIFGSGASSKYLGQ